MTEHPTQSTAGHRYVVAYESTHTAMASEDAFKRAQSETGISVAMLPTPNAISAGCGMALRFVARSDEEALAFAGIPPEAHGMAALYRQTGEGIHASYQLVAPIK